MITPHEQRLLDHPPGCPGCGLVIDVIPSLQDLVQTKEEANQLLEKDLRIKRSQLTKLTNQRNQKDSPHMNDAVIVFEYWRQLLSPKAREFNGKRLEAVLARLAHGATVDELKEAIEGVAAKPYVGRNGRSSTGNEGDRQTELELICRSEAHVQRFRGLARSDVGTAGAAGAAAGARRAPIVPGAQVLAWHEALIGNEQLLARLRELRAWNPRAVKWLKLGVDRNKIVIPVRDEVNVVTGLIRYQPNPHTRRGPKSIAEGPRQLFPPPESYPSHISRIWLVEGESDAISMISAGLPAVAVPGIGKWDAGWPHRFERFQHVYVCFDCDEGDPDADPPKPDAGRETAEKRANAISTVTRATVIDLDPSRKDGYDVGDLIREMDAENDGDRGYEAVKHELEHLVTKATQVVPLPARERYEDPVDTVFAALEAHDCRPIRKDKGITSRCPAHDDRHPSLSVSEGHDGRALIHCHRNCTAVQVMTALGLNWKDLFPESRAS